VSTPWLFHSALPGLRTGNRKRMESNEFCRLCPAANTNAFVSYGRILRWNSLGVQAAVTHHPRSCSASAGRDSLRSVGHDTNAPSDSNPECF
ncbi:MAG: hypothetical protein ACK56W_01775, partial [Pirellula sp.]